MTQGKKDKLGVKTNTSRAKSKTADQRAKKRLSATLLCILGTDSDPSRCPLDALPGPVREWVTGNFMIKVEGYKLKHEGKPEPRIITEAVESFTTIRPFRVTTSSTGIAYPTEVVDAFKGVDQWSFDVFALHDASKGHSLKYVMCEVFNKYDLLIRFKIPLTTLISFAEALEEGYGKYENTYHNAIHAADVTQTVHSILLYTGSMHWFTDLEILAMFFSTSIHDYEHTGTTNGFHIQTRSEVALLYNDTSILENHHLSAAYRLVQKPEQNIFCSLTEKEWREVRQLAIKTVLGTDMSNHFQGMKNIIRSLQHHQSLDKSTVMSMMVHVADVSHPAKNWYLHRRWSEGIYEEFFKQGDLEAELELLISPLCDRRTTNIPESQIGFLDVIVAPIFALLFEVVERSIVPFLRKVSSLSSRANCRKTRGASEAQNDQTGISISRGRGQCTGANIHNRNIPEFQDKVMGNIEANRTRWKNMAEQRKQGVPMTLSTIAGLPLQPPDLMSSSEFLFQQPEDSGTLPGPPLQQSEDFEISSGPSPQQPEDFETSSGPSPQQPEDSGTPPGPPPQQPESPEKEIDKAKDRVSGDKARPKKPTKRTKSRPAQPEPVTYCTVPQTTAACDCQLCDNTAFEPMDVNFIIYNSTSPEIFLPRQDSDGMEVTESYEELADSESSWRKSAGQTVESNMQEMRALAPKTKPLSPNESDDLIIEEFIPDDPRPRPELRSGAPASGGQQSPQLASNVGFIMTDLTQSDMDIFSLWNAEVMRRAAEQQKEGGSGMPADGPLQVAVSLQQAERHGFEGASVGTPPETFILQVISFDSPSLTYSKDAFLNCDPGLQAAPCAPTDGAVPGQNQTDPEAAAVSVTSLRYGTFKMPQ